MGFCAHFFSIHILKLYLLLSVIVCHMVCITCLLSALRKIGMEPIKTINPNSCYDFLGLVVFRYAGLFEYRFIHCIRVNNVLGLL